MTYKKRYSDPIMQNAYMNACDCLYYGYGKNTWNDCGIHEDLRDIVWKQAWRDMTKDL